MYQMDSTLKVIEFVMPKNKYTIFYYKIPVSFGSPYVYSYCIGILSAKLCCWYTYVCLSR